MERDHLAFPGKTYLEGVGYVDSNGMLLRDWFAGQALIGLMAWKDAVDYEERASMAYKQADAMMKFKQ